MPLGRLQPTELEILHRHPWIHARVFGRFETVLRNDPNHQRQDLEPSCKSACRLTLDRCRPDLEQSAEWVPIVVVGNKSDLKSEQRQVSAEEGKKIAEEFNCGWTEASARLDVNVARAFELMIAEVEKSQNPTQPAGESKCCVM